MAKATKKKKSNMSNKIGRKKTKLKAEAKLNPFEIRFTKAKHTVVNRPVQRESGKPGITRALGIKKRKETLLQEYKMKDKTNVFMDRRIGEKDNKLSAEDKMIARFTAERMKNHGKKSIFNLGGEEQLTHFGKSLAEIERLDDDPRSDDEEDEESKRLDAEYVSQAHFGGFLTRSDIEFAEGKSNTRKEWIDTMIADSKKRKADRQRDNEDTLNMTVDLDKKWKTLMPSLKTTGAIYTKKEEVSEEPDTDPYNILMRELAFESKKGMAQERLKTEEEIIAEEKERLENLEADRIKRMKGEVFEDIEDESSQSEADMCVGDEAEGEEKDSDEEESSEGEEESEEEDAYSDLEEEGSETEEQTEKKSKKKVPVKVDTSKEVEEAKKQIPFTFRVPQSYEELLSHFEGRNSNDKATILERIIKCNHPQFGDDNKARLETLFTFVLQHLHDCGCEEEVEEFDQSLETIQKLAPFLFDMAKFFPQSAAKAVSSVVQEKYDDYIKTSKIYPTLETLIFFKLTILLFPSSDYRHPVVTPALQFMSEILLTARPNSRPAIAAGLFISSLMTEAISLSKRYSPDLLNFLVGIVYLCVPKDANTVIPHVPPFKVVGKDSTLLCDTFKKKTPPEPIKIKMSEINNEGTELDNAFASSSLNTALQLLIRLADLWRESPSAWQMFQFLDEKLLSKLPVKKIHCTVVKNVDTLKEKLAALKCESKDRKGAALIPKKAVTMLKLYEPEIEDNFDPFSKKHGTSSSMNREKDKLIHKMKREKKSAKKELRKDTAFLAKQKFREIRERDADRQVKTKAIMGGLGSQEGEFKKMQASKTKKQALGWEQLGLQLDWGQDHNDEQEQGHMQEGEQEHRQVRHRQVSLAQDFQCT